MHQKRTWSTEREVPKLDKNSEEQNMPHGDIVVLAYLLLNSEEQNMPHWCMRTWIVWGDYC